jgi:hypothetical protein
MDVFKDNLKLKVQISERPRDDGKNEHGIETQISASCSVFDC